jgi:hypothetical protein
VGGFVGSGGERKRKREKEGGGETIHRCSLRRMGLVSLVERPVAGGISKVPCGRSRLLLM